MSEESIIRQINDMKRRHSIQVLLPSVPIPADLAKHRRQSLTTSLHTITKSMSKAMHLGSSSGSHLVQQDIKSHLTKHFFRDILAQHYHQHDLKVTKINVRCLSTAERLEQTPDTTLTDLLLREEEKPESASCFWFQGIYEAEVWVKCDSGKRKLDLVVMWPPKRPTSETGTANSSHHSSREVLSLDEERKSVHETDQEIQNRKQSLQDQIVVEEDESESAIESHEKGEAGKNGIGKTLGLTANKQRAFESEREYKAYKTIVRDLWNYLQIEKGIRHPEDLLSLPTSFEIDSKKLGEPLNHDNHVTSESESKLNCSSNNGHSNLYNYLHPHQQQPLTQPCQQPKQQQNSHRNSKSPFIYDDLLVLQDLFSNGYRMATVERDETGLDYTHTILALEKLAAFHAVSYCMRKEKKIDLSERYPMLQDDPVYRPATAELFSRTQSHVTTRLHNIFQQNLDGLNEFSAYFLDAVQNWHEVQQKMVKPNDKFGVICHGDLWRQNVLYGYGSCMEAASDVIDVRFIGLHNIRFSSCVTDLVYFIFTSVDTDVRRDHAATFLMVYHDHFVKTVRSLCGSAMKVFSREELFAEYQRQSLFGFLEALSLFSTAYEGQLHRAESVDGFHDAREHPRYQDYRDTVLALIADVIRIRFQGILLYDRTS